MNRLSKSVLWGSLLFFAAGYLLVLVGKSQAIPRHHKPFSVVNQAGAIVVVIYADEWIQPGPHDGFVFSENGNTVAVLAPHTGLTIKEFPR